MSNESFPSSESAENISKEEVIAAYQKFIERGATNPDSLDLDDPEVQAAHELYYKWIASVDSESGIGINTDASLRGNLAKTMFYVDAGFTDPIYLGDIYGMLEVDMDSIPKDEGNPENVETRRLIAEAMRKVRSMGGQIG